jgi:hypothetical protein
MLSPVLTREHGFQETKMEAYSNIASITWDCGHGRHPKCWLAGRMTLQIKLGVTNGKKKKSSKETTLTSTTIYNGITSGNSRVWGWGKMKKSRTFLEINISMYKKEHRKYIYARKRDRLAFL